MDDIKLTIDNRSNGSYCLSSEKLSVADFGKTLEKAKDNFKKAVNLMLDTKLDEIK